MVFLITLYTLTITSNIESTLAEDLGGAFVFTGEGGDPVITIKPGNGQEFIVTGVLQVTVTDLDSGVNASSVVVQIGADIAFQNEAFQLGYDGDASLAIMRSGGTVYDVFIDVTKTIPFGSTNISITANDNVGN